MKNDVYWDIGTQFIPQRKHITSPLESQPVNAMLRFEIFTAVTMKNAVFWDVTPCDPCMNRCFVGTYRLHHQGDKNW
jgi:hypothetical protein